MKLKKQFIILIPIFILIIILIIISIILYKNKNIDIENSTTILDEYNIDSKYYSDTLEYMLENNLYDSNYLEEYSYIEYIEIDNFGELVNLFLNKGYNGTEINYIFKLSEKNIDYLSNLDYIDISNYYMYSNFSVLNIDRYNTYYESNNYSYEDVVTYVNINLDKEVYTDTLEVQDPDSNLVLVNKYNYLPSGYTPDDLVYFTGYYGTQVGVRSIVLDPLNELFNAASDAGISFMATTAYRSESFQKTLYNNYVAKDGVDHADTYSARPGYSEHQTGLAIDLKDTNLSGNIRLSDEDFEWLNQNAYKYGFIIRFPEGKEFITGYQFENWHIRYVGVEAATIIHDEDLTLEEYIDLYITEY